MMDISDKRGAGMSLRVEASNSLDDFPTPPWATRALCEALKDFNLEESVAYDPACGRGDMVETLEEAFENVYASDIEDYGEGYDVMDFVSAPPLDGDIDWLITNPPFNRAEEFLDKALAMPLKRGVALLVRVQFLETIGRFNNIFSKNPPSYILQFSERVPMRQGRLDPSMSTATSYCWVLWLRGFKTETIFRWIPPCRREFENPGDYDRYIEKK